jgi:hypothetical protein
MDDSKDISFTPNQENQVSVKVKGTLYGFIFNEEKLTKKIVENLIEDYDGAQIYIQNIKGLNFSLIDKENISFADVKNIKFSLKGTPKVIWKVDAEKFTNDILNKKKRDFNQILSRYPSISSAVLVIRPFWKNSFPEKSKNIEIIINYPE